MISLGIDQSYNKIGIAVVKGENIINGKIVKSKFFSYKGMKTKTEKREFIRQLIPKIIKSYKPDIIVVERIRIFSQGFISKNYMISTGALIATIVDSVFPQEVYSADTRSWKSKVCGKSKGEKKGDKQVSVKYVNKIFNIDVNDDEADAICIALYGLQYKNMLKREE